MNTTKNALRKPATQRLPCAGGDVPSTRQHPGYRWAGWNVIADYTGDGSWTVGARTMSYTPGLAQAQGANPTTAAYQYSMADHLGSVRQITAQDKSALAHYAYTPYGETDFAAGLAMTHGYTGHRWDAETGLYFAPFRYYAPQDARWMKRDPIGFLDGMNLYGYVLMSPVMYRDLYGLLTSAECDAWYRDAQDTDNARFFWETGHTLARGVFVGLAVTAVTAFATPFVLPVLAEQVGITAATAGVIAGTSSTMRSVGGGGEKVLLLPAARAKDLPRRERFYMHCLEKAREDEARQRWMD